MAIELVLWGLPKGKTDRIYEEVLYTQGRTKVQIEKIKVFAKKDGWHSFRIQKLDLSIPPDFVKVLRKNKRKRR